jgi:hypothetical protein
MTIERKNGLPGCAFFGTTVYITGVPATTVGVPEIVPVRVSNDIPGVNAGKMENDVGLYTHP